MTGIYFDELFLQHDTGYGHPECAGRLQAIRQKLDRQKIENTTLLPVPEKAPIDAVAAIHSREYIAAVTQACENAPQHLDGDTVVSAASCEAAFLAAGAALAATDAVCTGTYRNAFCAVRPPGHHAERDHAMGFCLFNNIAIAAAHLQRHHGLQRVLILDWDVHHGNGTQNAFYTTERVYFVSFHQWPFYPGSGMATEIGAGAGAHFTRNIPFPAGTPREAYLEKFKAVVAQVFAEYAPEFVLISAGFDAHYRDPLAQMNLTEADYGEMTRFVLERAGHHARGRVVSLLEGGYDLEALARSVHAHVAALATASPTQNSLEPR